MRLSELKISKKFTDILKTEGISQLYPPQEHAINSGILEGKNLVLATPTASGKTLVAELAISKVLEKGKKAVYVVPLRALAYEKFLDFRKYRSLGFKVRLEMGDLDSGKYSKQLDFDILVTTAEKLDSILRSRVECFKDVGILVMDEIHLISSDRGPVYEIIIAKFNSLFPKIQILALSATIRNAGEIAEWLKAGLIESEWRPVKLIEESIIGRKFENLKEIIAKELSEGGQVLVFVNSRRSAESVAEKLSQNLNLKTKSNADKLDSLAKEILTSLSTPTKQCRKLSATVKNGTAFHHAGIVNKQRTLVEDSFKRGLIKVIVATPTLCLPFNTELVLSNGDIKKIGELVETHKKGDVLSLNMQNLKLEPKPIKWYGKRKTNELIKIKTRTGKEISCTPNHPFLVITEGELEWKSAKNLRKGAWLATPRILKRFTEKKQDLLVSYLPKENLRVILNPNIFSELVDSVKERKKYKTKKRVFEHYCISETSFYKYISGKSSIPLSILIKISKDVGYPLNGILTKIREIQWVKNKGTSPMSRINIPAYMNNDFMHFLGYMISDGSLTKKKSWGSASYTVTFTNSDKKKIKDFAGVVTRLFGKRSNIRESYFRDGVYQASFVSKIIGELLVKLGFPSGRKAHRIRLPEIVFSLDETLKKELLGIMWACDGYLHKYNPLLEYYTSSRELAKDMQILLLYFGVVSTISKKKRRKTTRIENKKITARHDHYTVHVAGKFAEKLTDLLSLNYKPRYSKRTYEKDQIPVAKLLPAVREELGISMYKLKKLSGVDVWKFEKGNAKPLRSTLQKIANSLGNKTLGIIANSDIYWDEVTNLKKENANIDVYDLEIKDEHNFIANGIFVHNSFGVNLPSRTVIIRDIKRYSPSGYYEHIPVLEYKQMCLPYSAKILMGNGSLNEIGYLVENRLKKKVISFDPKNEKVVKRKISGYFRRKSDKLIEINCGNFRLEITPEHPVLTKKGWIKAINLGEGDEIARYYKNQDQIKWLRIDKIKQKSGDFKVYNISIEKTNTYIAENFVLHNCGRAGRPKYDPFGKAILLAKDGDEKDFLVEKYINGEIEKIQSRLGVEPVLRFHILAAVASQFSRTQKLLMNFLKLTFFSYQFGLLGFEEKIEIILEKLQEWNFIRKEGSFLFPTNLGARVSELYIDPQTAYNYISLLKIAENERAGKFSSLGLLEMLCDAVEMPLLRVRREEEPLLWEKASKFEEQFLRELDSFDLDANFLERFKTSMLFNSWINEISEDLILEKYKVAPGILYQKLQIMEWLAYSAGEISKILKLKKSEKELRKLEFRIKNGIKEELIPLVHIRGIGRVRARKLFNAGIKNLSDVKKASIKKVSRLIGKKVAEKVKEELRTLH